MRVLIINKFLYPNGGSETYIFKLGEALEQHGHEVQYFGMEHEGRCVGNRVNAYTSDMDFHGGSKLSKLTYPIKTIYSKEARVQLRKVLDDFKPDVCHLNNFNYQLTPSIILEIVKWRKETGRDCKIIFTAHDYQLVCPNHMLNNPNEPFGFSLLLSFLAMFFYLYAYEPIHAGKGWKNAIVTWYQKFKESVFFRRLFFLAFVTSLILFRTLLNRQLWMNPLSDVMGGWGIWETVNGEQKLTTECIRSLFCSVFCSGWCNL